MKSNENTGSVPNLSEDSPILRNDGPGQHPTEQPTTIAGGIVGPLEEAIEKSEETAGAAKRPTPN